MTSHKVLSNSLKEFTDKILSIFQMFNNEYRVNVVRRKVEVVSWSKYIVPITAEHIENGDSTYFKSHFKIDAIHSSQRTRFEIV